MPVLIFILQLVLYAAVAAARAFTVSLLVPMLAPGYSFTFWQAAALVVIADVLLSIRPSVSRKADS